MMIMVMDDADDADSGGAIDDVRWLWGPVCGEAYFLYEANFIGLQVLRHFKFLICGSVFGSQ